jgi:peptide methionine sulfoxide reductase MsrB
MKEEMKRFSKDELKKTLTPLQYKVTQEKATERPYTGEYDNFYEKGKYQCIVCKTILFKLLINLI